MEEIVGNMATEKQLKYWASMKGKIGNGFKPGHPDFLVVRSKEHYEKISKAQKGKKISEQTKQKIREKRKFQVITEETKIKIGKAHEGSKNTNWKGDKAGYTAIHDWIRRWKGAPKLCEMCGTTKAKKFEWANLDHEYRRVIEDYMRMCTKCHRNYDKGLPNRQLQ